MKKENKKIILSLKYLFTINFGWKKEKLVNGFVF
jgi:hypothetical protein